VRHIKFLAILVGAILVMGCYATMPNTKTLLIETEQQNLKKFAYANCLLWYFQKKGYDETDIRAVSGGYVEKSRLSAEKFQQIALLVKDFTLSFDSKNNIDPDLYKCFSLEESQEISDLINRL